MKLRLAALLLLAMPLAACASSHLTVEQPYRGNLTANAVNLVYGDSTVDVSEDAVAYLRNRMEQAFYTSEAPFARGNDVTVRYRFLTYDRGSRAARYFLGGLAGGEAKMLVEAEFLSPAGERLALVRAEGEVGAGAFGGSHNSAIDQAVQEIREYADTAFRR